MSPRPDGSSSLLWIKKVMEFGPSWLHHPPKMYRKIGIIFIEISGITVCMLASMCVRLSVCVRVHVCKRARVCVGLHACITCPCTASGLRLFGNGVKEGGATVGRGKERRDVGDDGQHRAGLWAVVQWGHGDDDVVLVPDVEGVAVGVGHVGGHVQRGPSQTLVLWGFVLNGAQQAVCRVQERPRQT